MAGGVQVLGLTELNVALERMLVSFNVATRAATAEAD